MLRFDFKIDDLQSDLQSDLQGDAKGIPQRITTLFRDPLYIIQTANIEEVVPKLAEVERATHNGLYAAGYVSYEASPAFESHYCVPPQGDMPLLWFAIFDQAEKIQIEPHADTLPFEFMQHQWHTETTPEEYHAAISRIKAEIAAGNTYQVNYTIRLHSDFKADAAMYYDYLQGAQKSDYCAYLETERFTILSASPELFFHLKSNHLVTKPMKGTAARGMDYCEDIQRRDALAQSLKNRAENVMIVDLLRNDLSKISGPNSVDVSSLFSVEKYPTVWQLTSTIETDIPLNTSLVDVFKALFPCGSITGAPKASTMRLIKALEPKAREVYCGAIGFITPTQEAIFNVPIRTVIIDRDKNTARYGVGGGITWDSVGLDEYQEVVDKYKILQGVKMPTFLLESILLKNILLKNVLSESILSKNQQVENNGYILLDAHIQRLQRSAEYFDFVFNAEDILMRLDQHANALAKGDYKVRLQLYPNGKLHIESQNIYPSEVPLVATFAPQPMNTHNRFLYHKTSERDHYPIVSLDQEYLLYNQEGEITEFVNGNVALLLDDVWLTPALACGLLAGTMRGFYLANGKIREAVLTKAHVVQAQKIAFMNSVRGWREVTWQIN